MEKLKVYLENCYGIKKLDYTANNANNTNCFNFTKNKTCIIYAPNGTMKTSFANTFMVYSKGGKTSNLDRINPSNKSTVEIKDEKDVFVIQSYDAKYKTDKLATLLLNTDIKKDYDEIFNIIETKKKDLISKLSNPKRRNKN